MDLCIGAQRVIIATDHLNKKGESKILKKCTLPLTAAKEANLIVTDLAVMEVTDNGLVLKEIAPEVSIEQVIEKTDAHLIVPQKVTTMNIND